MQPFLFRKRNEIIRQEIPDGHKSNGNQLSKIEIHFKPAHQEPEDEIVDPQAYKAYYKKFSVLYSYIRVITFKSPGPVYDVV